MGKKANYKHGKSDDFMAADIDMAKFLDKQSDAMEFISSCDHDKNLVSQYAEYLANNFSKSEIAFSAAKMGLLVMTSELARLDRENR